MKNLKKIGLRAVTMIFVRRSFVALILMTVCIGLGHTAKAHQAPTTIVLMDVNPDKVTLELQLPLSELELAFGHDITKDPQTLLRRFGPQLGEYLRAHIHAYVSRQQPWYVSVENMRLDKGDQIASGPPYWELIANVALKPTSGEATRDFYLDYDVIMHQVINHAAFVSVRNDWSAGTTGEASVEAGVIRWDLKDNVIYPLHVTLESGSWWKGFKSMVSLGMEHIRTGTDHLLFLVTLLLPAMLLCTERRWGLYGGFRYSIGRLVRIVTAFTVGHSCTLILGAMGWVRLPSQPIEILIAASIFVSAIHAIRPIFPGKEVYIAIFFGLIHGLAFASVLADLHLDAAAMTLSIMGFNLGIELMQLFIIFLLVPWLILVSRTRGYSFLRIGLAIVAAIASIAWVVERSTGESNMVSAFFEVFSEHGWWFIIGVAGVSLTVVGFSPAKNVNTAAKEPDLQLKESS